MDGCDSSDGVKIDKEIDDESVNENLIVIKQTKYVLRAIAIENGSEKWNIRFKKKWYLNKKNI